MLFHFRGRQQIHKYFVRSWRFYGNYYRRSKKDEIFCVINQPTIMTNSEFSTRRYLKMNRIQLDKNSIHVTKTSPFESREFDIAYENLETKKTVETEVVYGLLIIELFSITKGGLFFLSENHSVASVFIIIAGDIFDL